jgi:hypothetical protein
MIHSKLHVDLGWLNKISINLERFKKIKTDTYNCRCLICGDSKTRSNVTRLYFYAKKGNLNVFCQNCGYSHSFFTFMKEIFPSHFEEYKRETMFDTFNQKTQRKTEINLQPRLPKLPSVDNVKIEDFKRNMVSVLDLEESHPAKKMLRGRAFSETEMSRLYYTDDFKYLAQTLNEESTEKLRDGEPRIIIPFISPTGVVEMIQGRSLDKNSKLKYISIKRHDDVEKVYGLYELDKTKTRYCVEGPFDSLFVDNCIATCDANLTRVDADCYIWDVQPRNKDVCKYMEAAIESNKKLVIWPFSPSKKLDINDMIKAGVSRKEIMKVIKDNTFSGLTAKVKFMQWKKV